MTALPPRPGRQARSKPLRRFAPASLPRGATGEEGGGFSKW
nr:MAG TPA: hypothetical protein [Caudoviricetes sp.]